MTSFTTLFRAAVVALAIAATAAPAALAADGPPLIVPDTSSEHGTPSQPLAVPTTTTEHGDAAGLTQPLIVPTGSTEHVAGVPTVIIQRVPANGFDWGASMIGALVAMASALLAYGIATVLRSRSRELVEN